MKLIIAEKPSVAKNIADALNIKTRGNGYIECEGYYITWAFGHLLELYDAKEYDKSMANWQLEKFPFIPENFKYKVKTSYGGKVDAGAKKQLDIISELINRKEVKSIVSATDYDREGQIIADIIFDYLEVDKKIYRLLLNEWTPAEVLKGLKSLKLNSELQQVSDAGISRQWADWLIGINLTSLATLKYKKGGKGVINIGRVLMPTLKIVYDRDKERSDFKPENFYRLIGEFKTDKDESYTGMYMENNDNRFSNEEDIKKLSSKNNNSAKVIKREKTRKKDYMPYLFSLSSLQGHITSKYKGWSSKKVLEVAQSLYEKKFITYPRTDSRFLEESLKDRTEKVLNTLKKGLPYEEDLKFRDWKRVFDNDKVEGHSAITPTYLIPNRITKDENILYEEIKDRFLMQFLPVSEYDETIINTKIKDVDGVFVTKGRVMMIKGWKEIEGSEKREDYLPNVNEGEDVKISKLTPTTHQTTPPAMHTEKSLLSVMNTAGRGYDKESDKNNNDEMMDVVLDGFSIGTAATRADTINKLQQAKYIETKGKSLTTTSLGKSLVENFPVKDLFDLGYTGRLEKTLHDIEKGEVKKSEFIDLIKKFVIESSEKIKKDGGVELTEEISGDIEVIGLCPECGQQVIEDGMVYGCSGKNEGCDFIIWKNDKFLASMKKKMTKTIAKNLLKDGEVRVDGLVSKKGNKFDAILSYKKGDKGFYNWDMSFPKK